MEKLKLSRAARLPTRLLLIDVNQIVILIMSEFVDNDYACFRLKNGK